MFRKLFYPDNIIRMQTSHTVGRVLLADLSLRCSLVAFRFAHSLAAFALPSATLFAGSPRRPPSLSRSDAQGQLSASAFGAAIETKEETT
jgi:hypothetical protein